MGRIVLQMMISLDGMVSGPKGELDWIANDETLQREHLARVEQASAVLMGSGLYPEMPDFWAAAAQDEKSGPITVATGRAMTETRKIVFSHTEKPVKPDAKLCVVKDDKSLAKEIEILKRETDGLLVTYGGVRFARSLIQQGLLDEIHLDICPVILGAGQPLFTDLTHRTNLRVRETEKYDSGTTMVHYEVVKAAETATRKS